MTRCPGASSAVDQYDGAYDGRDGTPRHTATLGGLRGRRSAGKTAGNSVPRDRIELPTRGFSIPR
jgi:hypothetical protein